MLARVTEQITTYLNKQPRALFASLCMKIFRRVKRAFYCYWTDKLVYCWTYLASVWLSMSYNILTCIKFRLDNIILKKFSHQIAPSLQARVEHCQPCSLSLNIQVECPSLRSFPSTNPSVTYPHLTSSISPSTKFIKCPTSVVENTAFAAWRQYTFGLTVRCWKINN